MTRSPSRTILVDARELTAPVLTGIGRVVIGLIDALVHSPGIDQIQPAVGDLSELPAEWASHGKIIPRSLPARWMAAEWTLTRWSREAAVFISPYPKLPVTGVRCSAVHIVHDVLDMTVPPYCHRRRTRFDRWRLGWALDRADLSWFDSTASLVETRRLEGHAGRQPRVRFPGIDSRFQADPGDEDLRRQQGYGLAPGYILAVGNGRPHKNLGVALAAADALGRPIALAGVGPAQRAHWEQAGPCKTARWIGPVAEADLPALYRGAHCLVQPSLAEGYGYPPLEAMACGVPAIVSSIDVLIETTGGRARACDPRSVADWREAMIALDAPDHRAAASAAGLAWSRRFQGRQAWQSHVDDIETLVLQGEVS